MLSVVIVNYNVKYYVGQCLDSLKCALQGGNPDEIAETLYFLQSEKASFITGQIIGVNGGYLI